MKEHLPQILAILRSCYTFAQAKALIARELTGGKEPTSDAITSLFRREGLEAPTSYLADPLDEEFSPTIPAPPRVDHGPECGAIAFIPDIHAPYHDPEALRVAIDGITTFFDGVPFEKRTLVLLGDVADMYKVSRHSKDPKRRLAISDELGVTNEVLDLIDQIHAARKVFCEGNHETRLARFISERCPEISSIIPDIRSLLRVAERGYEWVPYRDFGMVGKMMVTHDLDFCGKYAVVRSGDDIASSVAIGHTHRMDTHHGADTFGNPRTSCSFGCLVDFQSIDYKHRAKALREWVPGFGLGHQGPTGDVYPIPVPIINGQCVVNGKIIGKVAAVAA